MLIKVLGPGCPRCNEAEALVKKFVADNAINATIEKITDFKEMMQLGVMSTPAVVIDGVIKCTGRIPTTDELKDWLAQ